MTPGTRDHDRVRELLGREPRGRYEIVVRDPAGDPVVIRNAPLLDDGTPMPTRFWLVAPDEIRRIGRLEAAGGVDDAERAVDPTALAEAHVRYADERDAAMPPDHDGPRPSGGVGGTRRGVKCLHAHWAWHLAGGDDPVGRWIERRLAADDARPGECTVDVAADTTTVGTGAAEHRMPWGYRNLTDRWLRADDPPRPDALTNALGTLDDHLDDAIRLHPEIEAAREWTFAGPTISSLAALEAGFDVPPGVVAYERIAAEEVFRLVATETDADRALNPGLPSHHVEFIVATSCIVQACMRRFHLDVVGLRVAAPG